MARGRKSSFCLDLSLTARETLERWPRSTTIAAGLARRGKIIRLLAPGHSHTPVAQAVGVQRTVVRQWARRFLTERLAGLTDAPGRGAKGDFSPRGRDPRGAPRVRTPGPPGPSPLAVGWHRMSAAAPRGGDRRGPLPRPRPSDARRPPTEALAPSCLALPQAASGRGLLCHRLRADRPRPPAAACG